MWFILWICSWFCAPEYDVIVVGSSPFCILEAVYQDAIGNRVLMLEEQAQCGGAWKTIDICGVHNVDMGCHDIVRSLELKEFLESIGCTFVSLENPTVPFDPNKEEDEYYFSKGCAEFMSCLMRLVDNSHITVKTLTKVETVTQDNGFAYVQTNRGTFTANKVIGTPKTFFCTEGVDHAKTDTFFHLYMLLQDPTLPRFTHRNMHQGQIKRLMNMTYFAGMEHTGRQLLIVQTHERNILERPQELLEILKAEQLVDPAAFILQTEPYIYEVHLFPRNLHLCDCVEILDAENFASFMKYLPRWNTSLLKRQ